MLSPNEEACGPVALAIEHLAEAGASFSMGHGWAVGGGSVLDGAAQPLGVAGGRLRERDLAPLRFRQFTRRPDAPPSIGRLTRTATPLRSPSMGS